MKKCKKSLTREQKDGIEVIARIMMGQPPAELTKHYVSGIGRAINIVKLKRWQKKELRICRKIARETLQYNVTSAKRK